MPEPNVIELAENQYLSEYFNERDESLPSGRIDKRYTGIGATRAELTDPKRSSIVVLPLRAVAASKADFHKCYYFGSTWNGIRQSSYREVIKDIKDRNCRKCNPVCQCIGIA